VKKFLKAFLNLGKCEKILMYVQKYKGLIKKIKKKEYSIKLL